MFTDFGTGTDMGLTGLVLTVVVIIVLIIVAGLVLGPGLQTAWSAFAPLLALGG